MKLTLTLLVLLALLMSCTLMESIKATASKTAELAAVAKDTLAEAKATYADAKAEADTDGDGKTSSDEWLNWLLGLGGIGGVGGIGVLVKGAVRNAKSDGRKDAIEARVDALEKV